MSVITPSMGRPERLRENMESLYKTMGDHAVEVIVVTDDDLATARVAAEYADLVMWRRERGGAPVAWNIGAAASSGELLVLGSDDVLYEAGWLEAALEAMQTLDGFGLVGFNDLSPNAEGRGTHYMISRDYAVDVMGGVMIPPCYDHNFTDWEMQKRAEALGCYVWAEEARVPHMHFDWNLALMDETYRQTRRHLDADRDLYFVREATGFPNDWPAYIGFR